MGLEQAILKLCDTVEANTQIQEDNLKVQAAILDKLNSGSAGKAAKPAAEEKAPRGRPAKEEKAPKSDRKGDDRGDDGKGPSIKEFTGALSDFINFDDEEKIKNSDKLSKELRAREDFLGELVDNLGVKKLSDTEPSQYAAILDLCDRFAKMEEGLDIEKECRKIKALVDTGREDRRSRDRDEDDDRRSSRRDRDDDDDRGARRSRR